MSFFGITKIKEEEFEEIRLLKADEAMDEEAINKLDALLMLVKAVREGITETEVKYPHKFYLKILADLNANEEEIPGKDACWV